MPRSKTFSITLIIVCEYCKRNKNSLLNVLNSYSHTLRRLYNVYTYLQKFVHPHVGCTRDVAMRTRIAHFKTWSQ